MVPINGLHTALKSNTCYFSLLLVEQLGHTYFQADGKKLVERETLKTEGREKGLGRKGPRTWMGRDVLGACPSTQGREEAGGMQGILQVWGMWLRKCLSDCLFSEVGLRVIC